MAEKQHKAVAATGPGNMDGASAGLPALLSMAVAPLGVGFPSDLLKHVHGTAALAATPEAVAKLLAQAGFGFVQVEGVGDEGYPVLVWQRGKDGWVGPWLKVPDGQWSGNDGQACAAPRVSAGAVGIAVTEAPMVEEGDAADIWRIVGDFKPQLMQVAGLGLLINVAGVAIPLFSMAVYDRVLPVGATRTLWLLTLGIGLVLALDIVLRMLKSYALTAVMTRASLTQDPPLLATLLRQRGTGTRWADQLELMRLAHEVREQVILHIFPTLADIPFVLLFLLAIGYVAPALLPVPLVLLVVTLGIQLVLMPRLRRMAQQLTHVTHLKTQTLLETFRAGVATRLMNRQHEALGKWNLLATKVTQAEAHGQFWNGFGQQVTITMAQLSFIVTLIVGAELVMRGGLTVGALVATSLLCSRTIAPALHLIDTVTRLQNVRANVRLMRKGLDWPLEALTVTDKTPETLANCRGEVTLANVGVRVGKSDVRGVLGGINVRFGGGERWAVVGGIGAGKSTLLAVMAALIEATEGEAKLDGVSFNRMPVAEIRRHILLVGQTPVFGDVTVREIICGLAPVDDKRMQVALEVSGFDGVLAGQGAGLEFQPGANGERLSGGQRQMLALAVALYAEPKVLLLDEPTSQFDPDAERAFCVRMQAWLKGRGTTVVLVTHRSELLELVDNMLVLVQGRMAFGGNKTQVLNQLKADKGAGHGKRAA